MIQLSNGAKVLTAFIVPASPGMKPNGVALAETETDFVVWSIYWDGETTGDAQGQTHELWECETGHYFQKSMEPDRRNSRLQMAEQDFGIRLSRFLTPAQGRGVIDGYAQ